MLLTLHAGFVRLIRAPGDMYSTAVGDVTTLPNLPIAIFHAPSHWVAMLPLSALVLQYVPIPLTRVLAD